MLRNLMEAGGFFTERQVLNSPVSLREVLWCCCLGASLAILPACRDHSPSSTTVGATAPQATGSAVATPYANALIPDARLAGALEAAMSRDPVLRAQTLRVSVGNGNVVLFGSVPTLAAKWRAARLVGAFKGVLSLTDGVVVSTPARPDAELARDVSSTITGDAATRNATLRVTADAGTATLTGTVESYAQRELVADIASRVRGVRDVKLGVAISPSSRRADAEIEGDVADNLLEDARLDGPRLGVHVHAGVAAVSGIVGSLSQRDAAEGDAMRAGASSVDMSALRVDWHRSARDPAMARQRVPRDADIVAAVTRALSDDPRVGVDGPMVSVERGAVTLSGDLRDFRSCRAAVRDARMVSGVWRVEDRTTVLPVVRQSDATIQRQVLAGIYDDVAASDSRDVRVSTAMARVTLRGTIASRRDKAVIEDDVEAVPGVAAVQNDLQIQGNDQVVSPETIRHGVAEGLFWDPRIAVSDAIAVEVSVKGDVTLTGQVESWQEARAAGDDAVRPGAAHVINHVQVGSDASQ